MLLCLHKLWVVEAVMFLLCPVVLMPVAMSCANISRAIT